MKPLIAWYGDDFTGSAAVLEVLAFAGIESVLFLKPPTPLQRNRFQQARAIGYAGDARAQSPAQMDSSLPKAFESLRETNASVVLYKICSTLDSTPELGSIGHAIDIGQTIFSSPWVPFLVAAPKMQRFQCFGNVFAGAPSDVYRLDRHPVMSRHPITPMKEADVSLHLSHQTNRSIGLIDARFLHDADISHEACAKAVQAGAEIIAIDALSDAHMQNAGALIWASKKTPQFTVGSQGIAYALVAHWAASGLIPKAPETHDVQACDRVVAVSGSVSAISGAQIAFATQKGFAGIAVDPISFAVGGAKAETARKHALDIGIDAFKSGCSPLIYTATSPDDPSVDAYRRTISDAGIASTEANRRVGANLGKLLRDLIVETGTRRVAVCGGDTSSQALKQLDIFALEALAPTSPGAALFQAASEDQQLNGLEIALKGGQMGRESFYVDIRDGCQS